MKCSLGISNLLEEISSFPHSIVFLYFFALITEEGFLKNPLKKGFFLFAFLFLGDGLDPCLLYNVMSLHP